MNVINSANSVNSASSVNSADPVNSASSTSSLDSLKIVDIDSVKRSSVRELSSEISFANCQDIANIPFYSANKFSDFQRDFSALLSEGHRPLAYFSQGSELWGILSKDRGEKTVITIMRGEVPANKEYRSFTSNYPSLHLFEREIFEQYGIIPLEHPWLKPVRKNLNSLHFKLEGSEVHEVAVGPVHAGVIPPGHFRFQCHGETVHHLEISLGYQHRGVEQLLVGGPSPRSIYILERVAGDSTVAHAWAYCQNIENLAGIKVSRRTNLLRTIMLELERLANHTGDLGALAGDVGYLPTASFCGRIRGDYLNLTAAICGNRFGRSMLRPGGTNFDLDISKIKVIRKRLQDTYRDTIGATNLLWNSATVLARFENTGIISKKAAVDLGVVGVAARAAGVLRDARKSYQLNCCPHYENLKVATASTGDVWGRAWVRKLEIDESYIIIDKCLKDLENLEEIFLHEITHSKDTNPADYNLDNFTAGQKEIDLHNLQLSPNAISVAVIEGWAGEVCQVAITDQNGKFSSYKIVDPAFHNWTALAHVLRGQEISDFPLCNKSFNLSYSGFDL